MSNETNKVAIVTGASRGIGAAVAERLAADGFTVVINYSGDTKSAEALARKIEGKGGRALTAKADVSDASAVRGMFDAAEAAFGGVDVLVNNAGIMKLAKIADSDDALFDQQVAINLKGSFNAMREAARRLRDDASGEWRIDRDIAGTVRAPVRDDDQLDCVERVSLFAEGRNRAGEDRLPIMRGDHD